MTVNRTRDRPRLATLEEALPARTLVSVIAPPASRLLLSKLQLVGPFIVIPVVVELELHVHGVEAGAGAVIGHEVLVDGVQGHAKVVGLGRGEDGLALAVPDLEALAEIAQGAGPALVITSKASSTTFTALMRPG